MANHKQGQVNCAASDQSKQAITCITKLANLAIRCLLPVSVAPVFCTASLTALMKLKKSSALYSCGRGLSTFIPKMHSRKKTELESAELISFKQPGV